MRTGNEPLQARSPLKIRCGLALWGVLCTIAGAVAFVDAGRPEWAAACAALAMVAATDLAMVIRHIRQGPHYQPGKDIPPTPRTEAGTTRSAYPTARAGDGTAGHRAAA